MSHLDSSDCPQTRTTRSASTPARRAGALTAAMSLALLTAAGAALAVPSSPPGSPVALGTSTDSDAPAFDTVDALSARAAAVALSSRSNQRGEVPDEPEVIGKRYVTVALNVRKKADPEAKVVATLAVGDRVRITDVKDDGWRQIIHKGQTRWVTAEFLSKSKPPKPKPVAASTASSSSTTSSSSSSGSSSGGISTKACASGSRVESGLAANTIAVHRAVCNRYPQITAYGGYRPGGGNHTTGHALDIMVSGSTGWEVAKWVRANASKLGVTEVIHAQKIWTTQRASAGWRSMADRGSATANHYDHVHVSTR